MSVMGLPEVASLLGEGLSSARILEFRLPAGSSVSLEHALCTRELSYRQQVHPTCKELDASARLAELARCASE